MNSSRYVPAAAEKLMSYPDMHTRVLAATVAELALRSDELSAWGLALSTLLCFVTRRATGCC